MFTNKICPQHLGTHSSAAPVNKKGQHVHVRWQWTPTRIYYVVNTPSQFPMQITEERWKQVKGDSHSPKTPWGRSHWRREAEAIEVAGRKAKTLRYYSDRGHA